MGKGKDKKVKKPKLKLSNGHSYTMPRNVVDDGDVINVVMFHNDERAFPVIAMVTDGKMEQIVDSANDAYEEVFPDQRPFYGERIIAIDEDNPYFSLAKTISKIHIPLKVRVTEYPENFDFKVIRSRFNDDLSMLVDGEEPCSMANIECAIPRLVRPYGKSDVYLHFLFKPKGVYGKDYKFTAAVKKEMNAILKRFEKSGITPKKLAAVKMDKLLRVEHSTFQGDSLNVFTTDKNKRAWLKSMKLTEDD